MPGSACKQSGFQAYDTVSQSFAGRFQNAGSEVIPVTCPIARAVYDSDSLEYMRRCWCRATCSVPWC